MAAKKSIRVPLKLGVLHHPGGKRGKQGKRGGEGYVGVYGVNRRCGVNELLPQGAVRWALMASPGVQIKPWI